MADIAQYFCPASQGSEQNQRNVPTFVAVKLKIVVLGTPFSSSFAPGILTAALGSAVAAHAKLYPWPHEPSSGDALSTLTVVGVGLKSPPVW